MPARFLGVDPLERRLARFARAESELFWRLDQGRARARHAAHFAGSGPTSPKDHQIVRDRALRKLDVDWPTASAKNRNRWLVDGAPPTTLTKHVS